MMNYMFSYLTGFRCDFNNIPEISIQPTMCSETSLDLVTQIPKNCKFIETVIDFKDAFLMSSYEITEQDIVESLSIFEGDIIKLKHEKPIFFINALKLKKLSFDKLSYLRKSVYRLQRTNKFVISFQPENEKHENPLIKYFKKHTSKVFKICFILLGPLQREVYNKLLNVMESVENELQFLEKVLKNKIFSAIDQLFAMTGDYTPNKEQKSTDEYLKKENDISIGNITARIDESIKEISNEKNVSELILVKVTTYLNKMKSFFDFLDKKNHLMRFREWEDLVKEIESVIIEKIKCSISKLNFSNNYRKQILNVYIKEINGSIFIKNRLLRVLYNRLKIKTEEAARVLILETHAFRFDVKKKILEEVREVNPI
ncbi:hypothetical protein CDIK_1295 [Cucumispora dikerogammari]|nr:hypothetical protein CDIK_1295 [Cucumispora dikerogammari]